MEVTGILIATNNLALSFRRLLGRLGSDQSHQAVQGCSAGAVVRALASHQCSPDSISRLSLMCGLSLLVLYSRCTERFFSR